MINLTDYIDFYLFLGGLAIIIGIIYPFFRRLLQNIFISEEEVSKLKVLDQIPPIIISFPKIPMRAILFGIIIGAFLFNQFLMWKTGLDVSITITKK